MDNEQAFKTATIHITIRMPRIDYEEEENGVIKRYIKQLTTDDLVVIIKDKFINWKDLVNIFLS